MYKETISVLTAQIRSHGSYDECDCRSCNAKRNAIICVRQEWDREKKALERKRYKEKYPERLKEGRKIYRQRIKEESPWVLVYYSVVSRCKKGKPYYERGVRNYLTINEVRRLWLRDKAYKLKRPSIDRINGGSYIYENCRFIELKKNIKRGAVANNKTNAKHICQIDKRGKIIAYYKSIGEACRSQKLCHTSITRVLQGKQKYGGGYRWEEVRICNAKTVNTKKR